MSAVVIAWAVIGLAIFVTLVLVTMYMAFVGVLGAIGVIRYVRCPRCAHLVTTSGGAAARDCAHCRHVELYHHPLHVLHDAQLGNLRRRRLVAHAEAPSASG